MPSWEAKNWYQDLDLKFFKVSVFYSELDKGYKCSVGSLTSKRAWPTEEEAKTEAIRLAKNLLNYAYKQLN